MKRFTLVLIACGLCFGSFANRVFNKNAHTTSSIDNNNGDLHSKTTHIGDTTTLSHVLSTDTLASYTVGNNRDSGFTYGTNMYNDAGFAEFYSFNSIDSSVSILGVFAMFDGRVNPMSTDSVVFKIWDQGAPVMVAANVTYSGYPNHILDSQSVSFTHLGIDTTSDTLKKFLFATPLTHLSVPFFAGFTINTNFNSLNGDTIGLQSTLDGERHFPLYTVDTVISGVDTTYDTVINVQNTTLWSDNQWYDNYSQSDSLFNALAIYPIIVSTNPTGIKGITKNNLTLFGNYPNPANNNTNIRFALNGSDDVTITILNTARNTVKIIMQAGLQPGEHIVAINTQDYPAGDYYYILHTRTGDGFAGKIAVFRQ